MSGPSISDLAAMEAELEEIERELDAHRWRTVYPSALRDHLGELQDRKRELERLINE